jgi:hypothetical protein
VKCIAFISIFNFFFIIVRNCFHRPHIGNRYNLGPNTRNVPKFLPVCRLCLASSVSI